MDTVVLINPPGRHVYLRDYYCSKISKGSYCYQPSDFVVLSGILSQKFNIRIIDCIAEGISIQAALLRVAACKPAAVVFLTGAVSFEEDRIFMARVKAETGAMMVGLGDIFLDDAADILGAEGWLDAACLDFTSTDLLRYLSGERDSLANMVYKSGEGVAVTPLDSGDHTWRIPLPRHDLFNMKAYSFPFMRRHALATMITNFGCTHQCSYCPAARFSYKERPVEDLSQEFELLRRIGVREIFFKDQVFGGAPDRIQAICKKLIDGRFDFGWVAFLRPETASAELLSCMKKAGCHTIMFGVESADENMLRRYKRQYDVAFIQEVFKTCRALNIETVATFILGLPGEDERSVKNTIKLSQSLGCDYASFNIFTPAYGTELRRELIDKGLIKIDDRVFMDSGVSYPAQSFSALRPDELWRWRVEAVGAFYFRPGYLWSRLVKMRDLFRIKSALREFHMILWSLKRAK
ncbi:MAG: radical SAM protein [Candidatus Omnitrophica bacterium]|nr:radical SAM protein [Candidatus Omnitrophota bacterium]